MKRGRKQKERRCKGIKRKQKYRKEDEKKGRKS